MDELLVPLDDDVVERVVEKKRKSSEGSVEIIANNENIAPKRTRASAPTVNSVVDDKGKLSGLVKPKSSLPRFNMQRISASSLIANSASVSVLADKKRSVTEQNTAERRALSSTTPSKSMSAAASRIDANMTPCTMNNALIKRLQKVSSQVLASDRLRTYFDNSFSFNDDTLSSILTNLKVKSKWDVKEKAKKQENAIKELKDGFVTTFSESKTLREYCLNYESENNLLMKELNIELQEAIQTLLNVRSTESKYSKLVDENQTIKESLNQIKKDYDPLKGKCKELTAKLGAEEKTRIDSESALLKLEKEYSEYKKGVSEQLKQSKEQSDQRIDDTKQELALLKAELVKKQQGYERINGDKADVERKNLELREEMLKIQSQLREVENSVTRLEKDNERALVDYKGIKEQLVLKESELRTTMNTMNELHSKNAEEKGSLRGELTAIQSRVHMLEDERMSITTQLATKKEECSSAFKELVQQKELTVQLESKLVHKESEISMAKEASMQLELEKELRSRCEIREEAERRERIAACAQLLATQTECNKRIHDYEDSMKSKIEEMRNEIFKVNCQRELAVDEKRKQADTILALESEVSQLRLALENASNMANSDAVEKLGRLTGEVEILRRRMRETNEMKDISDSNTANRMKELEDLLKAGEVQRRKLHNLVQELRGNVRVFARVRPFLPNDGVDFNALPDPSINTKPDGTSVHIARCANGADRPEEHNFSFDRVFSPSCSQESIFTEVSEFIQSALDGYNVCLFSYGQTGSGKTHTMQGSGSGSMRGIIPRAMQQVGMYKDNLESKGWVYTMEVSYIEIYNEMIKDLLRSSSIDDLKHEIKHVDGHTYITDITMMSVDPNNSQQMDSIMELAARHRSVGQTLMNERSSRSHSIFALHLKATNAAQNTTLKGTLSLVDLAGSERIDRSGATGDRLKESVAINKSLSALTDVFVAIGSKQAHIPFRNSKLTYLLQPALSGDGKTLMLVNLSPTEESYFESLCSLRFASQVNQCELGKPKRQLKETSSSASSTPSTTHTSTVSQRSKVAKK